MEKKIVECVECGEEYAKSLGKYWYQNIAGKCPSCKKRLTTIRKKQPSVAANIPTFVGMR